ncbi:hypothetical protein SteCoe_28893 [Stentor coeruleus]|uniref:Uncharacterized protein n=1 Tax=Stentor coeruleus TaxID=5963 RepID=A0A1R2B764_9CILI|nr:hypothetical protein SteCoe_28893 [Stentor coeruleus]
MNKIEIVIPDDDKEKYIYRSEISIQVDPKYLEYYKKIPDYINSVTIKIKNQKQTLKQKCILIDTKSILPRLTESRLSFCNSNGKRRNRSISQKKMQSRRSCSNMFASNFPSNYKPRVINFHEESMIRTPSCLGFVKCTDVLKPSNENSSYDQFELLSKLNFKSPVVAKRSGSYRKLARSPQKLSKSKENFVIKSNMLDSLIPKGKHLL